MVMRYLKAGGTRCNNKKSKTFFVLRSTCTNFATPEIVTNMETRKKTYLLLVLCIAWTILIFVLCTMPTSSLPKIKILHFDKAAHFGFFFVQSVLLSLLLRSGTKRRYWQIIFLSTLQAFIYGGIIEILQDEFFNRTRDLYDLMADMLGGFCGALVYPAILRLFFRRLKKYT